MEKTKNSAEHRILLCRLYMIASIAMMWMVTGGCGGRSTDELYRKALNAAANAQWTKAEELTGRVLSADDTHLEGRILHGISLYELQQPEEAESTLLQAAASAPDSFTAQYFYGWILFESGNYADALRPLKKAYSIRKDQPDLIIMLATCCLEQNLTEGLRYLQVLRRFNTYRSDPKVYNDMALLWLGQPDTEKAEKFLLQAYRVDPEDPVILQNLAVFYDRYRQDYRQAVKYYQMCLRQSRRRHQYKREARIKQRLRKLVDEMRTAVTE
ncbi:MAG: tetratricopeptide repeat protein [Lentisphaeria bacterium]